MIQLHQFIRRWLTSYSRCYYWDNTWDRNNINVDKKKNNIVLIQHAYYPKFSIWMWQNMLFVFYCVYVGHASLQYLNVSFYLTLRMYSIEINFFNHYIQPIWCKILYRTYVWYNMSFRPFYVRDVISLECDETPVTSSLLNGK